MKILIATILDLFTLTASTEDVTQPAEPFTLMLMPQFLEMVDNFSTLDKCKARGTELVNSTHIFNGFACEQGRAWIPADKVAVPAVWMPPQGDGS